MLSLVRRIIFAVRDMYTVPRPHWSKLHIWAFESPCLRGLDGGERLATLYRWKTGEAQHLVWFYRGPEEVQSPDTVEWLGFPEQDAARAATMFPAPRSPLFLV